jgi:hypothetical protein
MRHSLLPPCLGISSRSREAGAAGARQSVKLSGVDLQGDALEEISHHVWRNGDEFFAGGAQGTASFRFTLDFLLRGSVQQHQDHCDGGGEGDAEFEQRPVQHPALAL